MAIINVVPVEGRTVRDPRDSMTPLPPQGKAVEDTTYWQRRIIEGDVTQVDELDPGDDSA